jgi:hypothetical protein
MLFNADPSIPALCPVHRRNSEMYLKAKKWKTRDSQNEK